MVVPFCDVCGMLHVLCVFIQASSFCNIFSNTLCVDVFLWVAVFFIQDDFFVTWVVRFSSRSISFAASSACCAWVISSV